MVLLLQVKEGLVLRKNHHFGRRNRKSTSSKAICYYYGDKGHIRLLFHIINVKVPNGTMTWIPKCSLTNPQGPTIWVAKLPVRFSIGTSCLHKKIVVPR